MEITYSDWELAKNIQCPECLDYCVVKRTKTVNSNTEDISRVTEYWCRRIGCQAGWDEDQDEGNLLGVPN